MHYVIGTRGSRLALTQAELVKARLEAGFPGDSFEIKIIQTTGDRKPEIALEEIGTKGVFTDEIERQLLSGEVALAVHSMKDMPGDIDERLIFARAWDREDPRDVLISRTGVSFADLPKGAVIGTGSKRRGYQLLRMRPDLKVVGIRGNVDTRIRKLMDPSEGLDAIVVAAAGMKRLGREAEITEYFSPSDMIPAPTQGVLAIELRADNEELLQKVNSLSTEGAEMGTELERGFLKAIGGDCHYPIGAYFDGRDSFYALFGEQDGSRLARVERRVDSRKTAVDELLADVVTEIREKLEKN